jgi:hypothetical protein
MSPARLTPLIFMFFLTACSLNTAEAFTPFPTATTVRIVPSTPVPTIDREMHIVASPKATFTAEPMPFQCPAESETSLIVYTVSADLDYPTRSLIVEEEITYANRTKVGFDELVLNVRPNGWPEAFTLHSVTLGETELAFELTGQRLMVELPGTLDADCAVRFSLTFELKMPPIDRESENAYKGYLGYTDRQLNLGHWLPTMAVRQGDDWISHDEIPIGEQDILDDADWDVTLNVSGAPDGLKVAAPGEVVISEPGHWQFRLPNARDFSLTMSDQFRVSTRDTESGVTVEMYSYEDALLLTDAGTIDTPTFALDVATTALSMYSDLYGEYPYKRMVVIQSDFPDGMEFSGLVFVGGEYFRGFSGPTSYLLLITVHEIAHQWWYGRVGNDQAIYPWLDEALAIYSEYVFIEEYFPALKDWWWSFRVDVYAPEGFVDSTVYEFDTRRAYINAVYLRGAQLLQDLRAALGTDAFFDWLRRYAEGGAGQIVEPTFFWSLLTPEQFAATAEVRDRYFRLPQIAAAPEGEQTPEAP